MNLKKILIGSMFLGGSLALTRLLFARLAATESAPGSTSFDDIDAYIEEQMRRLNIPGVALAIVEGERISHIRGFGRARPGGEAPTPQTPFFIGSLTKSFTALAIMQLVEAGKVELDAPLQRYLPWFRVADPQASAQMTVRQLLNQTSGLPMSLGLANLADFDSRPDAAERQAQALSTLVLSRPVGAKFEYTNLNYNLLGLVVEAASGETYSDYIQRHIFEPLDMRHSYTSQAEAKQDSLAVGHRYWFGFPFPEYNLPVPSGSLPSGQLISSAEDMAHFLIAQLNEGCYGIAQVLSAAGMRQMHHGVAEIREMGDSYGHYGMGWIDQEFGRSRIVSHSGIVPDFGAFMALLPGQNKGIVMLVNANHALIKISLDEVGLSAAQLLAGEITSTHQFGALPWVTRSLLLIPILQIVGILATLRRLGSRRQDPALQPSRGSLWGQHILLPLIPNLLAALMLIPMMGKMRGFVKLFMPDYAWIALICSGMAGIWAFLRTRLILQALRKTRP